MRNHALTAAIAAALLTPFALNAEVRHNYAEFDYRNIDGDEDGFGLRASVVIVPQLHVFGNGHRVTDGPVRRDQGTLALGWHHAFMQDTDLLLRGGWTRARDRLAVNGNGNDLNEFIDIIDGDEVTTSRDDGFVAQAGLRSMLTEEFELHGYVQHEDIYGGNSAIGLGGIFNFTPQFGVSGVVELAEEDTVYELGLRFTFDGGRFGLPER